MPSTSKKQHNFMAAVANNPKFAKKAGVSSAVGKEFLTADKGKTFKEGGSMKKFPDKNKDGKVTKADILMAKGVIPVKKTMKHGGMAHSDVAKDKPMMKKVATKAVKGHEKRMHGMAKGGGIEIKGKTKGKMVTMAKGGKACK
jgi:phosphoserine phosphatase